MKIAILSGKGGTGKTFVAVNLARVNAECAYVDCDVEEPNGALFLKPHITQIKNVEVQVPQFDKEKCTGCKACVDFCEFHALALVKKRPMLFSEVCHACGGCIEVCKDQAITYSKKIVGTVEVGYSEQVQFLAGTLQIGEASAIPVLHEMFRTKVEASNIILDCPPGSSCMAMESIQDADYCVLVAEPTRYGVHNLQMVYELSQMFHKPIGVVLNKCTEEYNPAEDFCLERHIEILGKIPFSTEIASENAQGQIVVESHPELHVLFEEIAKKVMA